MQCNDARQLMADALDEAPDDGLRRHLAACADCTSQWRRLGEVEAWLQARTLDEPPAHFAQRVMHRVDMSPRLMPNWQHGLLQILAILAGVATAAIAGAVVFFNVPVRAYAAVLGASGAEAARSAWQWLAAAHAGASGPLAWLVYAGLAIAIAAIWFGALVVPRSAVDGWRGRGS